MQRWLLSSLTPKTVLVLRQLPPRHAARSARRLPYGAPLGRTALAEPSEPGGSPTQPVFRLSSLSASASVWKGSEENDFQAFVPGGWGQAEPAKPMPTCGADSRWRDCAGVCRCWAPPGTAGGVWRPPWSGEAPIGVSRQGPCESLYRERKGLAHPLPHPAQREGCGRLGAERAKADPGPTQAGPPKFQKRPLDMPPARRPPAEHSAERGAVSGPSSDSHGTRAPASVTHALATPPRLWAGTHKLVMGVHSAGTLNNAF